MPKKTISEGSKILTYFFTRHVPHILKLHYITVCHIWELPEKVHLQRRLAGCESLKVQPGQIDQGGNII